MKRIDLKYVQRVALAMAVAIMVACSWLHPMESAANQQVDAGLTRALKSFATARALNAVISVVQGTEFGVGVKFAPGQMLRPLNDLVEQFAHLMLVASIAFGIEKILINIGAHWLISLFLTTAAISWGYFYLRRNSSPAWLTRILVVMLMIRFAMPIVIIGSDLIFQQFMADDYISSQGVVEATTSQISSLDSTANNPGFWNPVNALYTNIKSRFANLKQAAEQATERIIKVMVIFVLQTLVLPVFMLWVLWGIAKGTFEVPPEPARFKIPRKKVESPQP